MTPTPRTIVSLAGLPTSPVAISTYRLAELLAIEQEIVELRANTARLKSVLILANMALDTADAHLFSDEGNDLACQEIEAARAAIDAAMASSK